MGEETIIQASNYYRLIRLTQNVWSAALLQVESDGEESAKIYTAFAGHSFGANENPRTPFLISWSGFEEPLFGTGCGRAVRLFEGKNESRSGAFPSLARSFADYAFDKRQFGQKELEAQISAAQSFGADGWNFVECSQRVFREHYSVGVKESGEQIPPEQFHSIMSVSPCPAREYS